MVHLYPFEMSLTVFHWVVYKHCINFPSISWTHIKQRDGILGLWSLIFFITIYEINEVVLDSCTCHSKLPQIWWLKTTKLYSLSSGNHKSKIRLLTEPCSRYSREEAIFFQHLVALLILWFVAALLHSLSPFSYSLLSEDL